MTMTLLEFAQVAEELLSEHDDRPQPPGREHRALTPTERLQRELREEDPR